MTTATLPAPTTNSQPTTLVELVDCEWCGVATPADDDHEHTHGCVGRTHACAKCADGNIGHNTHCPDPNCN